MSILYCSLCLPDRKELAKLDTDLAEIDNLEGRDLAAKISLLLVRNSSLIDLISRNIYTLIVKGYFPYGQILNNILPYEEYIYSPEIDRQITYNNDLSKQRSIAKEMRILNLKLQVLLGNITNLIVQLTLHSP